MNRTICIDTDNYARNKQNITKKKNEENFLWFRLFVKITSYQRTFTNREKHSIEKRVE